MRTLATASFALLAPLAPLACGDDGGAAADSSGSSGGSGDTTGPGEGPTSNDGGSTVGDAGSTTATTDGPADTTADDGGSTTSAAPACGDGTLDDGEDCDDGNAIDGDGCNADCTPSGTLRWEITYDGPAGKDDCARGVAANASGQIAIAGETESAGSNTGFDILVMALGDDGTTVFTSIYDSLSTDESGGGSTDRAYAAAIEDDGQIIVAGHEYLDIETVWIRKYDTDGSTLWTRTGADTHAGRGYGIDLGPDDSVFVSGTHGLYAFASKYNTNGLEFWTAERKGSDGCNGCDALFGARPTDDGGVVVTGTFDNDDGDAAVVMLDADGNDVWSDVVDSGSGNDSAGRPAALPAGTLVPMALGDTGALELRNYDADGNVAWTLADPFAGVEGYVSGLAGTAEGGFVAVASGYDGSEYVVTLRHFDPDGAVLWEQVLTQDVGVYIEVRDLAVDGAGNIAIAGCRTAEDGLTTDVWAASFTP